MSTSAVNGAFFPAINVEGLASRPQVQGGSLKQLGGTLIGAVETLQGMILKIQDVVHMVFAEILGRLASIMTCFQSFRVCMDKLEEAFCPKPVASPDLGATIKQILASLSFVPIPVPPRDRPDVS
jgi:hypothetical protein